MSPERVSARLFTVVRGGILRAKAAQARRGLRKALGSTVLGSALALGFLEQAPLQELFGPAAPQHRSRRSLSDKILQPIQRKPAGLPDHVKRTLSVQSLQELQVRDLSPTESAQSSQPKATHETRLTDTECRISCTASSFLRGRTRLLTLEPRVPRR